MNHNKGGLVILIPDKGDFRIRTIPENHREIFHNNNQFNKEI